MLHNEEASKHSIAPPPSILGGEVLHTAGGTVAASDYYAQEMQAAADEAAEHLEREIKQEIDTVRDQQLQELCKQAGRFASWGSTPDPP